MNQGNKDFNLAEIYIKEKNYEAATEELLKQGYCSLAARIWLLEGKPDRALDVFSEADRLGIEYHPVEKRSVERFIKAGLCRRDEKGKRKITLEGILSIASLKTGNKKN